MSPCEICDTPTPVLLKVEVEKQSGSKFLLWLCGHCCGLFGLRPEGA